MSRRLMSAADVDAAIGRLGELQRERQVAQARLDGQVAKLKDKAEAEAQPALAELRELVAAIGAWCAEHRAEVAGSADGKAAKFPAGAVTWRQNPARVELLAPVAEVIAELKRRRLAQFVVVREEIDRQAILKNPAAVAKVQGLAVPDAEARGETIRITPVCSGLAEVVTWQS